MELPKNKSRAFDRASRLKARALVCSLLRECKGTKDPQVGRENATYELHRRLELAGAEEPKISESALEDLGQLEKQLARRLAGPMTDLIQHMSGRLSDWFRYWELSDRLESPWMASLLSRHCFK